MESGHSTTVSAGASSRVRLPAVGDDAPPPPPRPVVPAPWALVPVHDDGPELEQVQRWMRQRHVVEHWRQAWTRAAWAAEVRAQRADGHSRPWLVHLDGDAVAYVEIYRVALDVLAAQCAPGRRDLGIHLAIGDADRTGQGLGRRLLRVLADGCFAADDRCRAVFGDPDVAHRPARRAFEGAGFEHVADVDLPHKRAALMVRSRETGTSR